jgi:hypothetical protein
MRTPLQWAKDQLSDPTSGMHLTGFVVMGTEIYRHLRTGASFDLNAVIAALVCWGGGGAIDVAQQLIALRKAA